MIPTNIQKKHVLSAIKEINQKGTPKSRRSTKFVFLYKGKEYPPKFVLSLANKFANSEMLDSETFSGGKETNNFINKLGFAIRELTSTKGDRHTERCPKCKNTIESLLRKIYGRVEVNPKFHISTDFEDHKGRSIYYQLKKIKNQLEQHRGFKDFVKVSTLPRCDFFVQNPGILFEFDESQHFSIPRKISLQNYPSNLKLGYSAQKWISLCNKIKAKDNNPPYRDEQRAWYDVLRDFLPQINNLKPTVRLFSKDMKWCSLNPKEPEDVKKFKRIVEGKRQKIDGWIATVILQSDGDYSNSDRLKALAKAVDSIVKETDGGGVVLFPGGWFSAKKRRAKTIYKWVEQKVNTTLNKYKHNIIACIGVDGRETDQWAKDQIGIAISKKGIIAIGRKFHPAPIEKKYVHLARDHQAKEENKPRIFKFKGKNFFICVCYDSFGIKHKKIENFGINAILDLVHSFHPRGKGGSGDSYFARHGLAGASNHWKCPAYAGVVFFGRKIPERWPSGVYWDKGDTGSKQCTYDNITLNPIKKFDLKIKEGRALIRIFPN